MYQLKNLTKTYQKKRVLSQVNFDFPEKGLVCLMGESGTGKSTLLQILASLDSDYQGAVLFGGKNLGELTQEESRNYRKDYLGLIFQDYHLLEGYTALENVLYPSYLQVEKDNDRLVSQGKSLLKKVGLVAQEQQKSETLSGGQKQRVAIARALLNNPQVILADEPTGALDRGTATEIMALLKEIGKERLVILITHDPLICEDADQVLIIDEQKLLLKTGTNCENDNKPLAFKLKAYGNGLTRPLAWKNFQVNLRNYCLIAIVFAISATCLLFTVSANQAVKSSITDFQKKNSGLSNGFIKVSSEVTEEDYQKLSHDSRLENVYKQSLLTNITLKSSEKILTLAEKYPLPRAKEVISYGKMPQKGQKEIALSGTLAKQFRGEINQLIGEMITITINQKSYDLKVSGIYNAGYDDLYLSSDLEAALYQGGVNQPWLGITFDVKQFEEIVSVYQSFVKAGLTPEMALTEVETMLRSFTKIKSVFMIITLLVLAVCLFLIVVLMQKLQGTRQKIVGLLGAFGFTQKSISQLLGWENFFLASLTTVATGLLSVSLSYFGQLASWPVSLTINQIGLVLGGTFSSLLLISYALKRRALGRSIIESLK
ncbi:ATP-binding cassette domain-containing protein [Vagococcus salmoninarum]|uniref:ABC transporter ATP-binding protein/permease n=1 Tax=Vagococcus salmoninarum TaxID=2739 RepID=UPI00188054BC|nr:ATP-binding cassette domain-containing protein [Vagococcus salmoninarum]MBE9389773.1 ATP-binding cassette domain-containing protein [Vagococcus salmoninarum]